ncbi:MAG: hypothetical protein LUD25_02565 [Coriobacteriaceae bacterium]|nr:hypothetical protein [Coriobacteriaceae bacterium]
MKQSVTNKEGKTGMKKLAVVGTAIVMSGALMAGLTGCGSDSATGTLKADEITSEANVPGLAHATGWSDVEASFADLEGEAQSAADAVSSSDVRQTVTDLIDEIEKNVPALETGVNDGMDDSANEAARTIYKNALTLDAIGSVDQNDSVGVHICDLAYDAQTLVKDAFNYEGAAETNSVGTNPNVDVAQSEITENYDVIKSYTDEEWETFASQF